MINSKTDIVSDKFWYDDPMILIAPDRLTEFFPNKSFSLNEKLNSLVRLGLYVSIILILYYKNIKWGSIFLFSILLTYYIHTNNPSSTPQKVPKANVSNVSIEKFDEVDKISNPQIYPSLSVPSVSGSNPFYDNAQIYANVDIEPKETVKTDSKCTEPTTDNPFMNMTMKDYLNYDDTGKIIERPDACNTADPDIKKSIDNKFNNNLFKDVNDVFGKFNSERQYYTMPWTDIIPDINGDFKNWLYKTPKTCKEDQDYCLLYEDIRSKRPVINE
jgi:hypothetical protein